MSTAEQKHRLPADHRGWEQVSEPHREGVVFRAADSGQIPSFGMPGDEVTVLVDGSHTRGVGAFLEYRIAPRGKGPGLHWHRGYDELFYIVSGRLGVIAAGKERELKPRDFIFVPRGVIHSFWNPTDEECIFVSGWSPPGSEQIFVKAHEADLAGELTPERIAELLVDVDGETVDHP